MDEKDERIIEILKKNSRESFTKIAEDLEISEGTVRNRVEKMREKGIIDRFTVDLSSQGFSAQVMVKLDTDLDIDELVKEFPENITVFEVTGEYDMILNLSRTSKEKLNETLDNIRRLKGVKSTKTYSILKKRNI